VDLHGRRVLVTGASRGIGADLARHFAAAGAEVALVARSAEPIEKLAADLGGRAYPADLADRTVLADLHHRIELDGPIDVLVNNAGVEHTGPLAAADPDDIDALLDLNLHTPIQLCRLALPAMRRRGSGHTATAGPLRRPADARRDAAAHHRAVAHRHRPPHDLINPRGNDMLATSTTPAIPRVVEDITATWLTAALRSTGAATGIAASIDVTPIGVGVGLVGALARVTPTWVDGTGPTTVIAKLASPAESSRFVAAALGMYRKEVRFYRELANRCAVERAACFYADFDEETHDFVLLLGDLAGGRTVDQLDGCGRGDAELAVDRLADLHAGFWDDPTLSDSGWLALLGDAPFPESIAFAFEQAWGPVQVLFGDRIPAEVVALGDRFPAMLPALTARLSEAPCTLSHGDYRLDNLFFGDGDALAVCDWQLVDRSRGARDLAYFVTQNLTPAVREDVEHSLVHRYVERLQANGVDGYGFDVAWEDYRLGALLAFAYPVIAGGGLDHADPRATELAGTILSRCVAALVHLDCLDLEVG
jgi:hypothetical protein